ncbi:secretin N-terminal domain-containing protein [Neorhodopirellula lusitana]|uniref:secretin N-terminal domain-containing protein n=1 Tax=Neorhodopirellula lusitana TaxID=445327 RepID=UPI00384FC2C5
MFVALLAVQPLLNASGQESPIRSVGGKPVAPDAKSKEAGPDKPDATGKGEKAQPPPKIIRRDGLDLPTGDPAELKATVGQDGRVGFQFRNQGWVDIIGWLSEISDQPIDWQDLPGDTVNLISPSRLTVVETADLINRHLLARGYTLLELKGGITVTKTAAINAGMVRRVHVSELQDLPNHSFVRVMLDAGWLSADKLSEELKAMLSAAGKITPLATTNRIEIMDAAVNLRQVATLLAEERDAASRDALAPEFRLLHIPAEEAKQLLEQFLGVEKKEAAPMSREQIQMMQRMQQQGGKPGATKPDKADISIVANVRQNSVLVRAPIDRVAMAAEFIKRIDVPSDRLRSLTDASSRVDVFRLVSLDPEKLIEIAQEMNVLEPTTRIRVDKDNHAIIVSGAAADRFIIKSLIERLDGGKRRFEVLQLRRLAATDVAESIEFLMGKKEDKKENSRSRMYSYSFWGSGNDDAKDEQADQFRVAANSRFQQVLLWANEGEMEEVRTLLMKLGEMPPPGGSGRTTRSIEASATPETLEYLQRLKQRWQAISGTELVLPDASEFKDPTKIASSESESNSDDEAEAKKASENDDAPTQSNEEPSEEKLDQDTESGDNDDKQQKSDGTEFELTEFRGTPRQPNSEPSPFDRERMTLAMQQSDSNDSNSDKVASRESQPAPTIEIRLDSSGNLILHSNDTAALDKLENLMMDIKPPNRPYRVFKIEYASVILLTMDLEEYFEEGDSDDDNPYRWFWDEQDDEDTPTGLAKTGKLRFLANSDTNTIVVTGASNEQLKTIEELIQLWDVAEPQNPKRSRFTKLVSIKYGRAEKIAETIKDAYRDLLSSNDKAFSASKQGKRTSNREEGSGLEDSESGRSGGGSDFSFNGKMSLGVDEIGNTLVISAEGEALLDLITSMVEKLDRAAQPGGAIEIVQLSGGVSVEVLEKAMASLGASTSVAPQKPRSNRDRRPQDRKK